MKPSFYNLLAGVLIFQAFTASVPAQKVFPGEDWEYRTASAERAALGIDSAALDAWVGNLSGLPANSGMIVRNGYVVAAWGEVDDGLDGWVSTWKAQVGLTALLAHADGLISDFSDPIAPHVRSAFGRDPIEKDRGMTFGQLARNTSGYGRIEAPGEAFAYADASPNLAGEILADAVAAAGYDGWFTYMRDRLDPAEGPGIGFQELFFPTRRSTRDAARMAWLWANGGQWDGNWLVPEPYFKQFVKPLTPFGLPVSTGTDPVNGDYLEVGGIEIAANYQPQGGFGFWWYFNNRPVIRPGDQAVAEPTRKLPGLPHDAFTAFGTGGKYMVAIPSLNMALAINPYPGNDWSGLMDAVENLDRTPPEEIQGFAVVERSPTSATLTWQASNDTETGVSKYWIYRNGAWVGEVSATSFTDTGLQASTTYTYDIQAFNGHGYATEMSGGLEVTTLPNSYQLWSDLIAWETPAIDSPPDANPDGDGLTNWWEYLLDLDPLVSDSATIFDTEIRFIDNTPWFAWTFRQSALSSDATVSVEYSTDLKVWSTEPLDSDVWMDEILDPDPDNDGTAVIRRIQVKVGEDFARFLRLRSAPN